MAPPFIRNQLSIRYRREEFCLLPDGTEFTFGRGSRCTLRIARADLELSRHAGTIRWDDGLWLLGNDSTTRPFDVVLEGIAFPLRPRTPGSFSDWAISPSPPDLEIRIYGEFGPYALIVTNPGHQPSPGEDGGSPSPGPDDDTDDSTTNPFAPPSDRERVILAAKFLSLPTPGDAVGDREAAKHATAALPEGQQVTSKAAEDVVKRWRSRLQCQLNVAGIEGQSNINTLGRKLLALGVVRQEDRSLLGRS